MRCNPAGNSVALVRLGPVHLLVDRLLQSTSAPATSVEGNDGKGGNG